MNDADLLNWLEQQHGAALINDDAGRWAVTWDGHQTLPDGKHATDITTTFFVEAWQWHGSIRAAIWAAMQDYEEPER